MLDVDITVDEERGKCSCVCVYIRLDSHCQILDIRQIICLTYLNYSFS